MIFGGFPVTGEGTSRDNGGFGGGCRQLCQNKSFRSCAVSFGGGAEIVFCRFILGLGMLFNIYIRGNLEIKLILITLFSSWITLFSNLVCLFR